MLDNFDFSLKVLILEFVDILLELAELIIGRDSHLVTYGYETVMPKEDGENRWEQVDKALAEKFVEVGELNLVAPGHLGSVVGASLSEIGAVSIQLDGEASVGAPDLLPKFLIDVTISVGRSGVVAFPIGPGHLITEGLLLVKNVDVNLRG